MKADLHPTYYQDAAVTCACGNTFTTGSTRQEIRVEICAACHPFFTGEMRFVDTLGRVEKFQARQAKAQDLLKTKKAKKQALREQVRPDSLREMMLKEKQKLQAKEAQHESRHRTATN